jgi:hypothetical protein
MHTIALTVLCNSRNSFSPQRIWLRCPRADNRAASLEKLSLNSTPMKTLIVCHGFGCAHRSRFVLTSVRLSYLQGTLGAPHSAKEELLLVFDRNKLLRFHRVDEPVSRGLIVDGNQPHTTPVIVDIATGTPWSVDFWTKAYGQRPDIMTVSESKSKS